MGTPVLNAGKNMDCHQKKTQHGSSGKDLGYTRWKNKVGVVPLGKKREEKRKPGRSRHHTQNLPTKERGGGAETALKEKKNREKPKLQWGGGGGGQRRQITWVDRTQTWGKNSCCNIRRSETWGTKTVFG